MAYVINDTCVSCGSCAGECPVKQSLRETANTRSMQMHASAAEHVQVYVPLGAISEG